jgi:predicted  nucleic acid-binding Zn-ribbon protein
MRIVKGISICALFALCLLVLHGCGGKKADENKPISEVKTEAAKMDAGQLRDMAMTYKEAITAKKANVEKLAAKLKEIPVTKMIGDEAKQLKTDIDNLTKSISALKERFEVYYQKLKEKGGDLSGLEV